MKNVVKDFDDKIKEVMELITLDKKEKAREFFNNEILKTYERDIRDKKNPLVFFEIFFSELDDYLNNKGAVILDNINKDNIVGSYNSDYKEDLKLALGMEQRENKK